VVGVANHRLRLDDPVEVVGGDAQRERCLTERRPFVVSLVEIADALSYPMCGLSAVTSMSDRPT
jgi:hypothetical protein